MPFCYLLLHDDFMTKSGEIETVEEKRERGAYTRKCILVPQIFYETGDGKLGKKESHSAAGGALTWDNVDNSSGRQQREQEKPTTPERGRGGCQKIELGGYRYNAASRHLIQIFGD